MRERRSDSMKLKRFVVAGLVLGAIAIYWAVGMSKSPVRQFAVAPHSVESVSSLSELFVLSPPELDRVDIARMNLLCAQGLPAADHLEITGSLAKIDQMATRVRSETQRHLYRFRRNPAEFDHSEGFFRMTMLMVVLTEDFQVHYAIDKIAGAANAAPGDAFFANSQAVFVYGLTGAKPQGTCSSLPVLQVAVGRRLGYPLKLVTTKGHLFVRWEDARERFNFEAAGQGANRFADDYYRHWPFEVTEEEIQTEGYLKSLSPPEELAVFLSIRGMCWQAANRFADAAESFRAATRLSPGCRSYGLMQTQMEQKARDLAEAGVANIKQTGQSPEK